MATYHSVGSSASCILNQVALRQADCFLMHLPTTGVFSQVTQALKISTKLHADFIFELCLRGTSGVLDYRSTMLCMHALRCTFICG